MARLFAVGLSHRTAPVELRECVDFSRRGAVDALTALAARGVSREVVVLSTCNRAEIYAVAESDGAATRSHGSSPTTTAAAAARSPSTSTCVSGADAARHLFRVAAGLDSLVVGEPQILGQVKAAYAVASDNGFTGGAHQPAVPRRLQRRQARAARDRPRRRRRLGQLRGDRAGEKDLRRARRAERPDPRRRRRWPSSPASHLQAQRVKQHRRSPAARSATRGGAGRAA